MDRVPVPLIVADANVLIDFLQADPAIVQIIHDQHLRLIISRTVFQQIQDPTDAGNFLLEIKVPIENPTEGELAEALRLRTASRGRKRRLEMADWLSLLLARRVRAPLLTNDRALRFVAEEWGIPQIWGLEILRELVTQTLIDRERARIAARAIRMFNPYITPEVIRKFEKGIGFGKEE